MNKVYALEQARELVRMGWCQMKSARDINNLSVTPDDPRAVQFCPTGAISLATWRGEPIMEECFDLLAQTIRKQYDWNRSGETSWAIIQDWNDEPDRTKDEVVALFTLAIEKAKEA